MDKKSANYDYVRVVAAVPKIKVGDIDYNVEQILDFAKKADQKGASITVFPELSITGHTMDDLFHQRLLLNKAEEALTRVTEESMETFCYAGRTESRVGFIVAPRRLANAIRCRSHIIA
ncbi:MAG: hypothetical protein A3B91_02765 [Candidatus Yanofskybacteria bacterium RIFCSPHIGHO2_02_FULL_41_29]|uniref:CN hydrolase domain-containing protein n=1 Tax=Candidatus Yanofskybacteria bacterium RIFCSPHIGHO2_01_FULL_41_53 TaxID=1802663 RepID=A0A1F8EJX4_9BACT|nr:MAG: hypothetical protein A2650_00525 [Candidatus Yanofskybacteria bacterium RIFCSPHIGHO2_01_FULL_41_53]OGN10787.1 MAG: hypothetical protein A3B91_02765 [Candidatus Yanofskybacteria bacterium RIFCSPHIGHO2_02_FULL_41_29]OGN17078.1 MAG: hypothetical protein A3F48_03975 [Candidatus Yanofskybacteria bacterium RIFCSPHIGHO2_12_FULL_41_9]OGN21808.1 MAG: hypothetical protein A2916_01330 [Candidatus Yanofskybacteria bacterium RIFCSPLOWO2_01_FULL_41_67]OGN29422.1 MAG: hypothetical protein A3H54_04165 